MKKLISAALAASFACVAFAGCGSSAASSSAAPASAAPAATAAPAAADLSGKVTTGGSTSMEKVIGALQEAFMEQNSGVDVTYDPTGSGAGITGAQEGSLDIGLSSRALKDGETGVSATVIALDGIGIIVNNANTVEDLTTDQIAAIATGEVTNWKEVGGPDEPITLVTRPKTSGTRALFSKYAMGGAEEAANKSLETDNSGLLVQSVAQNKGAIGYVALPYLTKNDTVATISIDGVAPTLENTYSGKYNVWGYEHIYTSKNPKAAVKAFLDYILSADYGKRIEELGYGVSSKMQVKDTAHD